MKKTSLLIIIGIILIQSCKEKEYNIPSNFITINLIKDSIVADNFSLAKIEIILSNVLYKEKIKTVTLKTNLGSLLSTTVNFDSEGKAVAYLKSSNTGTASFEVTCNEISFTKEIQFVTSFPNYIIVNSVASSTNKIDQKIDISIDLGRDNGSISNDFSINYFAYDKVNNSIGSFQNIKPHDKDNKAFAEFRLQDTTYTGFVVIKAMVINSKDTITGLNKIFITNP